MISSRLPFRQLQIRNGFRKPSQNFFQYLWVSLLNFISSQILPFYSFSNYSRTCSLKVSTAEWRSYWASYLITFNLQSMNIGRSPFRIRLEMNTIAITVDFTIKIVIWSFFQLRVRVVTRANGTAPLARPDTPIINSQSKLSLHFRFPTQKQNRRLVSPMLASLPAMIATNPNPIKAQDTAALPESFLNCQEAIPSSKNNSPSATTLIVLKAKRDDCSPSVDMLQMLKWDRKMPTVIIEMIPEKPMSSEVMQAMQPHRKVTPNQVIPLLQVMNRQCLKRSVTKTEQAVPTRIETVMVNKKCPSIQKPENHMKSKVQLLLLSFISLVILLKSTIVTASFMRDSPKTTENSLGWVSDLMAEREATLSTLHIDAANRRISQSDSYLTIYESRKFLINPFLLTKQINAAMVKKLKSVPSNPQMLMYRIF